MDPIKDFHKTVLSLDNCIIPNERLINTPSSRDEMNHDLEVDLRIVGCEYIQSAGLLLRLPQVAMATAQVIFQRFYYSKSFVKYSIQPMSMACIFLAAKIEEDCRRLRDVINVFHHLKQKRMGRPIVPMEYMGEEYFKTKATVVKYERFLLKELGFCVHVKHPHKMIVTYLQILDMDTETDAATTLRQKAWNYMNDSLRANLFVRFSPETIACACIFLAARELKVPLCQNPPWWLVFDAKYEDIEVICREILALYRRPKKFLEDLEKEVLTLKEKLALKKQVEIKEVNVKKAGSIVSSNTVSPSAPFSPAAPSKPSDQRDRSRSKSPVPPVAKSRSSGTALLPTPPTSQMINTHLQEDVQKSHLVPPVRNGEPLQSVVSKKKQANSRSLQPSRQRSQSRSRSPSPPQRTLSSSSHSERSHTRSRSHTPPPSNSQSSNVQAYKPIHSPIKISSGDSDAYSPLANENGIPDHSGVPEQYKRDYEHDRRVRKSRHKHRPDKREKHHRRKVERSSSHERRRHRHREQRERGERDVYWERERDRDIFRDRERDVYQHDRDREYSKLRKSDSHRYR